MSITNISLKGLTARVLISPRPTTLAESTAVLKKLQSFGPVTSFAKNLPDKPRPTPTSRISEPLSKASEKYEVDVVFSTTDTALKACEASPFTVVVNHDLPNPDLEDPYNVRGLQSRVQPQPRIMTCQVKMRDGDSVTRPNILSGGFSPSMKTRLYQSLVDTKAPLSIIDGLSVSFNEGERHIASTAHLPQTPDDLAAMYRAPPSEPLPESQETTISRSSTAGIKK